MTQFNLSLLGAFRLAVGTKPINHFRSDKVRALLAYLAFEPDQAHNRRSLLGLLWPEVEDRHALNSLRVTLHWLRKTLDKAVPGSSEQLLSITRQTVQLHSALIAIDVSRFQTCLATAMTHQHSDLAACPDCLAQLTEAAGLYRGELLTGFGLADAPAFEEWLLLRREMLHQQALMVFTRLAQAHERRGDYDQGLAYATRLVDLDSYREESQRILMRLLTLGDQPDQALAHYGHWLEQLRQEMGVAPSPETMALAEEIRSGQLNQTAARPQPQTTFPPPSLPEMPSPLPLEVPLTDRFLGRTSELAQLQRWLVEERCRLVAILGLGGIGKTTLAAQTVRSLADQFELVIWRSLLNAPPLEDMLPPLLQILSNQQLQDVPESLDEQLRLFLGYLQNQRILLVLDNMESILDAEEVGMFRTGYEPYEQLIQQVATLNHQSHLLLTSRERPRGYARLERHNQRIQTLQLDGLDDGAGHELLTQWGLHSVDDEAATLIARYSGNPLAIKLVADTVDELFGGNINDFLENDTLIFDDIRTVLDQHFARLTDLEQQILFWLAVEREPTPSRILRQNLLQPPRQRDFVEALRRLQRRSLVEGQAQDFSLQNVVTEYLTERLIELAVAEIEAGSLNRLQYHALLKAQAKDYVRESQARLILKPIGIQLLDRLGLMRLQTKLKQILNDLRTQTPRARHYAGGNLLNLLLSLEIDVTGYDFSQLSIWQVNLQKAILRDVDFSAADFTNTIFMDTFDRVHTLAMHSGQQLLAFAGAGNTPIRLWHLSTGELLRVLSGHTQSSVSLAFHPAGHLLASGSNDETIRLWDVATGRALHTLHGSHGRLLKVVFSPDGTLLASACKNSIVCIWVVETGQLLATLPTRNIQILGLAFHPNGQMLVTFNQNAIEFWDVAQLSAVQNVAQDSPPCVSKLAVRLSHDSLQEGRWAITQLALSPDGTLLASGGSNAKVALWHLESQRCLHMLAGHTGPIVDIAFSPDSQMLASSSHDQTVRLWDVTTGQLLDVLRGHVSGVAAIAIGADGKTLASGGGDGVIRLWELQMSGQCRIVRTFQGSAGGFENLAISATGILADGVIMAAGGTRGWCHIWSMQGVLSPDAVTDDATPGHQDIRVRYQFALKGHRGTILTVAFRPNSPQVATGGNDETIRIWDAMSGRCLVVLQDPNATVSSVAYNPQGTRLASGEKNGVIHLWTIDDWGHYQLRHTIQASQRDVWAIAISPDGQTLASTALDRRVRLWDVETGACLQSLDLPDTHARTISFDPQGTRLAVAQVNGNIRLWNIVDRALVENTQTLRHTQAPINAVAFTPSGELLVSGAAEPILCIWDTMTGEKRHALSGCGQAIKDVALWPSSNIMASTGTDGLIRLSDIASGSVLHTINAPGPYEGMNITGVTGISEAQRSALKALGAVEAGEAGLSIVSPTKPD